MGQSYREEQIRELEREILRERLQDLHRRGREDQIKAEVEVYGLAHPELDQVTVSACDGTVIARYEMSRYQEPDVEKHRRADPQCQCAHCGVAEQREATKPKGSDLRCGDDDRRAAVDGLQEHFAAGRLTVEELDDRVQKVWAAKTYGELNPAYDELPGPKPFQGFPIAAKQIEPTLPDPGVPERKQDFLERNPYLVVLAGPAVFLAVMGIIRVIVLLASMVS